MPSWLQSWLPDRGAMLWLKKIGGGIIVDAMLVANNPT
jgi:hypothetical protein